MVIDSNNDVFLILVGQTTLGAIVANDPRSALSKFIRSCGFETVDQYAATFIGCDGKRLISDSNFIDLKGYLQNAKIVYYRLYNENDPLLVVATARIHDFDKLATYVLPKDLLVRATIEEVRSCRHYSDESVSKLETIFL